MPAELRVRQSQAPHPWVCTFRQHARPARWARTGALYNRPSDAGDRMCMVKAIPALVLLSAAMCLGVIMGIQYLRRVRSKPVMIGVHLLLGAGGLEVLAMMLRGAPMVRRFTADPWPLRRPGSWPWRSWRASRRR